MRGICFDMDGVLVRSEDCWNEKQREYILPAAAPGDDVPPSVFTGRNYADLYPELEERYTLAVTREEFEELFETAGRDIYAEEASLIAGTDELLAELDRAGVELALTTSSPVAWIELVDDRFGLLEYFEAVVSAAELDGPGKPAPDIYERGVAELGLDPVECVAVEDSQAGVQAAVDAGLETIGFRGGDGDDGDDDGDDGEANSLPVADEVVTGTDELRAALFERIDRE